MTERWVSVDAFDEIYDIVESATPRTWNVRHDFDDAWIERYDRVMDEFWDLQEELKAIWRAGKGRA